MTSDPYFKLVVFWLLASIGFSAAAIWVRLAGWSQAEALLLLAFAAGALLAAGAFFWVVWTGGRRA